MATSTASRKRRYDPARKERIVAAAMRVLADQGIEGFSLREVAAVADVPVGSLSYHFADREDLLTQTSDVSRSAAMEWTRNYFAERQDLDLPVLLGQYIEECTVRNLDRLRVDYQLLVASTHHAGLRTIAGAWRDDFFQVLRQLTDDAHAWALFYLIEGMLMQAAVQGTMFFSDDVAPVISATIGASGPRSPLPAALPSEPISPVF